MRQLRALAPLADARAQSPPESALRLRWYDAGLPPPRPQLAVPGPDGVTWELDLGLEADRFGAEYDGEEFHSSPADVRHDRERRGYLEQHGGWTIVVARRDNIYGQHQDIEVRLRTAYREHLEKRRSRGW